MGLSWEYYIIKLFKKGFLGELNKSQIGPRGRRYAPGNFKRSQTDWQMDGWTDRWMDKLQSGALIKFPYMIHTLKYMFQVKHWFHKRFIKDSEYTCTYVVYIKLPISGIYMQRITNKQTNSVFNTLNIIIYTHQYSIPANIN